MQLEQEILLVLQTQRTTIAREWQAAARAHWHNWIRSDFGRGTDVYDAVIASLSLLEARFREAKDPPRGQTNGISATLAALQDRTAEKWEALAYSWPDVQRMIQLLAECVDLALQRDGMGAQAGKLCALELAEVSNRSAGSRILKLEQDLATIREQAVLSQHLAGRFISNASHDLRTPLTAILGFTELLSEESYGELTGEQAKAVGHVYNSAQNLLEIVNNLIDIIQIQAGKLSLRCKRTEIAPVLEGVYALLASLAARRNLTFTIDVPNDIGAMNMDENIVRHIVYHLLSSSLRSTPSGGCVSLSAERTTTRVTFITTDTALKLPREAIDNMLGTVPLLENSPVRGYEGWEVGLALVRRYVELHEGTMDIDNGETMGTQFRVTLPAGLASSK